MLRVVVKDSEKTKQDTFIGQNAIPVTCIRQVLFFPFVHRDPVARVLFFSRSEKAHLC